MADQIHQVGYQRTPRVLLDYSMPTLSEYTWIAQTRGLFRFVAPSGEIALISHNDERWYHWLVQNTRPSDYVFDTDGTGIYFLRFDLRNPTELPYVRLAI